MVITSHEYDLFGGRTLYIRYFYDVKNSSNLLKQILNQEINIAIINAKMIVNLFHIHLAASRTLLSYENKTLTTNSLHSELIYNLSGSRNVNDSFRRFGIGNDTKNILICSFDEKSMIEMIYVDGMEGNLNDFDKMDRLTLEDIENIKKYFKIQNIELEISTLNDAVACRLATKNVNK